MGRRLPLCLVVLFSSGILAFGQSTPYPIEIGVQENVSVSPVNNSATNENVTSSKVSAGYNDQCNIDADCDHTKLLTCSTDGVCLCDETVNVELVYSNSLQKCAEEVDASEDSDEFWSEDLGEIHDEDMADNSLDLSESDTSDHSHHNHEIVLQMNINGDKISAAPKESEEDGNILGAGVGLPPIPQSCFTDAECAAGEMGKLSRCITTTGSCECWDTEAEGSSKRPMVQVEGVCYVNRAINDPCESHSDCRHTIKGKAWCSTDLSTFIKTCQCEILHFWEESLQECLSFGRDGLVSQCKTDYQCAEANALGRLSRCNRDTGKCECYDTDSNGKEATVYYEDTKSCFHRKSLNSFCTSEKECEASLGLDSICDQHPDLSQQKICQCMEGKSCEVEMEERPGISTYTMIVFIVAGIVMLVGIVLCFVLRRNDRYDIVSQSP